LTVRTKEERKKKISPQYLFKGILSTSCVIFSHPLKVIFIAVFINAGFGLGLLKLKKESGIEQYTPTDSTASQNREQVIY
jgi:predicted RND superfamily exporter protein